MTRFEADGVVVVSPRGPSALPLLASMLAVLLCVLSSDSLIEAWLSGEISSFVVTLVAAGVFVAVGGALVFGVVVAMRPAAQSGLRISRAGIERAGHLIPWNSIHAIDRHRRWIRLHCHDSTTTLIDHRILTVNGKALLEFLQAIHGGNAASRHSTLTCMQTL